jgi:hypothetical protein
MRGHTGGTMSIGSGSVYGSLIKQKLVTRSSNKCELVGVHDIMPQIERTNLFLQSQGYTMKDTVLLHQENKSAMLLKKNDQASSSKQNKHIHLRYFYIEDKIDKGNINIEHCPVEEMLAAFFTKPLQGTWFLTLRDHIMNIDPSSKYHSCHSRVVQLWDPEACYTEFNMRRNQYKY